MKKKFILITIRSICFSSILCSKTSKCGRSNKNGTAIEVKNPTVQISGDAADLYARWGITFKVDIPV